MALPAIDRAVYVDMAGHYNGKNNGGVPYSERYGAARLHVSKNTIGRVLKGLERCGLIRCTRRGSFCVKTGAAKESLWYFPYCGQQEQTEESLGPPEGPAGSTRGTRAPLPGSTRGTKYRSIEDRRDSRRGIRGNPSVNKTKEADQGEADIALLDEYRRRASMAAAAHVTFAVNGGGTTTVSS